MDIVAKLKSTEYDDLDANMAADEILRMRDAMGNAIDAISRARMHFLAGSKESGWALCGMRIALDSLYEGLGMQPDESAPN